ncbi:hypothetical protein F5Y17DRAFT_95064 [Xylariaceae sp. FL0594]|nr:hypothetical protein F5Y17DRAFT_95064 [Xylariaceae sp. FL0594]
MTSTFRSVNPSMAIEAQRQDGLAPSPTTPTPANTSFNQRPLPNSPFPQSVQIPERIEENRGPHPESPHVEESPHQNRISRGNSEDVDMDESDGEGQANKDSVGSDDESTNGDGSKSKKKKSQRFYCTDYPPCNLSFTRSEHLARHIRKHTGERPFQCHCARRFSRLDNLRQHAQTVHVNEDIPIDSLAATGTRFQRQIRTDRVSKPGRMRASTGGSLGMPVRGHSKSLSTSSISSVGSTFSTREDARRRPPPLIMAESRYQYAMENYPYRPPSPGDFSTPTSATFSTGQNSPRWGSVGSPGSSHARSHSMYVNSMTPGRRLSVPSGGVPFQSPNAPSFRHTVFPPSGLGGANAAPFTPTGSVIASPTSSAFARRDSVSGTEDLRRRTWHPGSSNFNGNMPGARLSTVFAPAQYPSPPQPQTAYPIQQPHTSDNAPGPVRLPGIESFISLPHRPATDLRENGPATAIDTGPTRTRPLFPSNAANSVESEEKRNLTWWDTKTQNGSTRPDTTYQPALQVNNVSGWTRDPSQRSTETQVDRPRVNAPTVRFHESVRTETAAPSLPSRALHQHTMSAPSIASSREKRRAWLQSAGSHPDTPPGKMARVDRMIHPNISEFPGFPARESLQPRPSRDENTSGRGNMLRLEALVAVATSEGSTTTAF